MNPVIFGWHAIDLLVQWKAPRWFRVLYALVGLAGNIAGQPNGITISRDRANAKVAAHLRPIRRRSVADRSLLDPDLP